MGRSLLTHLSSGSGSSWDKAVIQTGSGDSCTYSLHWPAVTIATFYINYDNHIFNSTAILHPNTPSFRIPTIGVDVIPNSAGFTLYLYGETATWVLIEFPNDFFY